MVNNGHLGSIREEVNYPVYRRWHVGCGLAQVNSVNGEVKSVIVLPHDSDSVPTLQETAQTLKTAADVYFTIENTCHIRLGFALFNNVLLYVTPPAECDTCCQISCAVVTVSITSALCRKHDR